MGATRRTSSWKKRETCHEARGAILVNLSGLYEATGKILIGRRNKKIWRLVVLRQKRAYW